MWQRIQSIYLILFSITMAVLAFAKLPLGRLKEQGTEVMDAAVGTAFADGQFTSDDHIILIFLLLLGTILAAGNIFLYKNRPMQSKMSTVLIFICMLVSILAFYLIYRDLQIIRELSSVDFAPGIGVAIPMIGLVLALMAKKGIDKDEQTVRSMDRLR